MRFNSELDLEIATIPFIEENFKYWSWQVGNYNRVIDFGGINKNGSLIGIEYKLSDWKTAIWQAVKHRLVFDFLYILIPERKISPEMNGESKKTGIGILLFNGKEIKVATKPKYQTCQWLPRKKEIIREIKIIAIHDRNEDINAVRRRIAQYNRIANECK